jgi:hypothetical protein
MTKSHNTPLDPDGLIQSIKVGTTIPEDFPSEGLFLLRLGPYLNDETLSHVNSGHLELQRAARIRVLAERLEAVGEALEDIGYSILESDEPSPADFPKDEYDERLEGWWDDLQEDLKKEFKVLIEIVESIETIVASQSND